MIKILLLLLMLLLILLLLDILAQFEVTMIVYNLFAISIVRSQKISLSIQRCSASIHVIMV